MRTSRTSWTIRRPFRSDDLRVTLAGLLRVSNPTYLDSMRLFCFFRRMEEGSVEFRWVQIRPRNCLGSIGSIAAVARSFSLGIGKDLTMSLQPRFTV